MGAFARSATGAIAVAAAIVVAARHDDRANPLEHLLRGRHGEQQRGDREKPSPAHAPQGGERELSTPRSSNRCAGHVGEVCLASWPTSIERTASAAGAAPCVPPAANLRPGQLAMANLPLAIVDDRTASESIVTFRLRSGKRGLELRLHELEAEIMDVVWSKRLTSFPVSDVLGVLEKRRTIAYTTVMT